ncbi:nucleotide exchange factor GrpE [candidate division KSB1 bacterium]|nr:nucleotide exchange factor GrpE [candidate division KSB1 bacterium]
MEISEDKATVIEIPISEASPETEETSVPETATAESAPAESTPTPETATSANATIEEEPAAGPLQECEDRFKRLAADFANYKRRVEAERNEILDLLEARLLNGILTIYDDFCRLSQHTANVDEQLAQGLKAVQTKWQAWLTNENVEMINPVGQAFDPNLHDALMQQQVPDAEKDGQVVHVVEYGYKRRERVLRHAKVIVGNFEAEESAQEEQVLQEAVATDENATEVTE